MLLGNDNDTNAPENVHFSVREVKTAITRTFTTFLHQKTNQQTFQKQNKTNKQTKQNKQTNKNP